MKENKINAILIYGPPGSGKGTHGERLGEMNGFKHFSTGDMFRKLNPSTELGLKVTQIMKTGGLVPDEIVMQLAKESIKEIADENSIIILDGLPRTIEQAEKIKEFVNVKGIINFNVKEDVLINRLLERGKTQGRSDDNPETIKNRMIKFKKETLPVLNSFPQENIIPINIETERDIEDVFKEVHTKVEKHLNK